MGFADSFNFITGGPTSNTRDKNRDEAARTSWLEEQDGAERNAGFEAMFTDPAHPNYKGPGYEVYIGDDGRAHARLVDAEANAQWKNQATAPPAGPAVDVNATLDGLDLTQPAAPPPPRAPVDITATAAGAGLQSGFGNTPALTRQPRAVTGGLPQQATQTYLSGLDTSGFVGGAPAPGAQAPTANRANIDPLLDGINSVQQKLLGLADETRGMSAAEAALHKASREADLRTAFSVEASQRGALGAARGARNRNDRALLERQAIGDSSFIGQEAARTQALTDVSQAGELATLRAGEEDADRRFKAEVLGKAADLGLNVAAVEVDLSKADLGSATNWLNNEFDKLKSDGQLELGYAQLDQQKTESILGFTKDMATLQFEYDKLSVEDQNATDALLMQKYGIDQQTMVALKQIKASTGMNWNQVLMGVIGAAGSGATAAIARTSDERLKTDIAEVDAGELEELLATVKAESWRYQDDDAHGVGTKGKRLGPMAQDLQRSKLGRSMVSEKPDGSLSVDAGFAGLAALSGVSLVWDKLRALEEAV
jgi:hypothetical protein